MRLVALQSVPVLLSFLAPTFLSLPHRSVEAGTVPDNGSTSTSIDVIVVGGGYSGLMSAFDLHQAGLNTLVLEAKDTIGGKTRTQKLRSGPGVIELGATWINNTTQPEVYALTEKFGLKTLEQYTEGDSILQGPDGSVGRTSDESTSEEVDVAAIIQQKLFSLINDAVKKSDIRNSSVFPEREDVTVLDWASLKGFPKDPAIQSLLSQLTSSIVGQEPDEVGAHYFFDYVKSGLGLESLLTEGADGAQSLMIEEGTTAIAASLADVIGSENVLVSMPVTRISQHNGTTVVTAGQNQTFTAKKVILAITPHTYAQITFSPPLPCEKNVMVARSKPGIYAKVILTYSQSWWRTAGLTGKFTSLVGPIRFSWEISNPGLLQYSLAIFVSGDVATCWHALSGPAKEQSIIDHLAELVGMDLAAAARNVLEINYVEWTKEKYIEGAPTSSFGPGMLRKFGTTLRQPVGDIHFAGTELAYEWKGYLEGALTSGQRAANEIIEALGAA